MARTSRRSVLASGVAGLAGLAGCTGLLGGGGAGDYRSYGGGPENTGYVPGSGPTAEPTVRWRFDRAVRVPPAVVGDTVYTVGLSTDGEEYSLFALSTDDGTVRWEYELVRGTQAAPAVADGTVYVTDTEGRVAAVSAADGTERWTRTFERIGLQNRPVVADGAVLVGVGNYELFQFGGLYALETADGSTRWRVDGDSAAPTMPAAANGSAFYVAFPDGGGELRSVSLADGERRWREPLDGVATGVAVDGAAHVAGVTGHDTSDGTLTAQYDIDSTGVRPPAVGPDAVYLGAVRDGERGVTAFERSGDRRWFVTPGPEDDLVGAITTPTVANETVYASGADGRLYALSTADGSERWRLDSPRGVTTPAVAGGVVYVPSPRGLYAVEAG